MKCRVTTNCPKILNGSNYSNNERIYDIDALFITPIKAAIKRNDEIAHALYRMSGVPFPEPTDVAEAISMSPISVTDYGAIQPEIGTTSHRKIDIMQQRLKEALCAWEKCPCTMLIRYLYHDIISTADVAEFAGMREGEPILSATLVQDPVATGDCPF